MSQELILVWSERCQGSEDFISLKVLLSGFLDRLALDVSRLDWMFGLNPSQTARRLAFQRPNGEPARRSR